MDQHLRTRHKVAGIRGPRVPERLPGRRQGELNDDRDPDVSLPARRVSLVLGPATTPGAVAPQALLACPRVDASGRIQLTAIARALCWTPSEEVVAVMIPDEQTVVVGQSGPAHLTTACRLDDAGRLRLSGPARSVLGIPAGVTQLAVAADPCSKTAVIRPGHIAATLLVTPGPATRQLEVGCG